MTARRSPTVRMRRLGLRLKEEREAAGLTVAVAATRLGLNAATLHRLEGGVGTLPKLRNVEGLLDLYGSGPAVREELLTLTREAREYGWWHPHKDALSESHKTLVGLETEAKLVRLWEPSTIPALLQTSAFAHAQIIGRTPDQNPAVTASLIEVRAARQHILTDPNPAHLQAVIGEPALLWMVGGREVMREQLEHLLKLADLPNVTLQVVPFTAGAHPATGPFSMLTLPEPRDPEIIFAESMLRDAWIEALADVESTGNVFEGLRAIALSLAETRTRIGKAIEDLS